MTDATCPICLSASFSPILTRLDIPASVGVNYETEAAARAAPAGTIELAVCESCGLIRNLAFEDSLLRYDASYENSQMFSAKFEEFATKLATDLVERYSLRQGHVAEIGCGKGEFLDLLLRAGVGSAFGYDPSFDGDVPARPGLRILRELYGDGDVADTDLIVARHVVEHLTDPLGTLRSLRTAVGTRATGLYVEVPDAAFVLTERGMWDIIYPHVNYFTAATMQTAFELAGWQASSSDSAFEGQFLAVHGMPGSDDQRSDRRAEVDLLLRSVESFALRFDAVTDRWTDVLHDAATRGPVALWGAGSKAVSLLNLPSVAPTVSTVVDVNVRKQGRHVPRTGHRIEPPERLRTTRPATVVLPNAVYASEVRLALEDLGLRPEVLCL